MLKLGEKGAILQRDKKTYAIAPDIPCGMVTTDLLRRIADVSERYHAQAIKITGASRIVIIGLKEEHIDQVWDDLRDCRKTRFGKPHHLSIFAFAILSV